MKKIDVSIILPAYNVSKYIISCLESIDAQIYKNYEVLIINDGSTDDTEHLVTKYIKNKSNFKLYTKKNEGVSATRNYGMQLATGKYLSFVDPDDFLENDTYELLVSDIKKEDAEIAVFGYVRNYKNRESKVYFPLSNKNKEREILEGNDIKKRIVEKIIGINTDKMLIEKNFYIDNFFEGFVWRNLYNKSFLERNNIKFDPQINFREDEIFNFAAFNKANKVLILNKVFYHYQVRENSLCTGYKKDYLRIEKEIFNTKKVLIKKSDIEEKEEVIRNLTNKFSIDVIGILNNICKLDSKLNWKQRQVQIKEVLNDNLVVNSLGKLNLNEIISIKSSLSNWIKWIILFFAKIRFTTPINLIFSLWMRLVYKI